LPRGTDGELRVADEVPAAGAGGRERLEQGPRPAPGIQRPSRGDLPYLVEPAQLCLGRRVADVVHIEVPAGWRRLIPPFDQQSEAVAGDGAVAEHLGAGVPGREPAEQGVHLGARERVALVDRDDVRLGELAVEQVAEVAVEGADPAGIDNR